MHLAPQVHRATLNGEEVVVKVQRQGLRALFEKDLKILQFLAGMADALDPRLDGTDRDWMVARTGGVQGEYRGVCTGKSTDQTAHAQGVYTENSRLLYREID